MKSLIFLLCLLISGSLFWKYGRDSVFPNEKIEKPIVVEKKRAEIKEPQKEIKSLYIKEKQNVQKIEFTNSSESFFVVFKRRIDEYLYQIVYQGINSSLATPYYVDLLIDCHSFTHVQLAKWNGLFSEEPPTEMKIIKEISKKSLEEAIALSVCKK